MNISTERQQFAEQNGMTVEFVNWFFDSKKDGCGDAWFIMSAAMWEGWKGNAKLLAVREAQPVAWQAVASAKCNRMITLHKEIVADWERKGFAVIPLYTAPPAPAGYRLQPLSEYDAMCEFVRNRAPAVPDWKHISNEWADVATSALVWLKNIADGISTPETAIENTELGIATVRAAMLDRHSVYHVDDGVEPVSQGYMFDGLNIRAVAALRESVRNQWLKSEEFADKVYWHNMHSIANEIIEAMRAAPTPTK